MSIKNFVTKNIKLFVSEYTKNVKLKCEMKNL